MPPPTHASPSSTKHLTMPTHNRAPATDDAQPVRRRAHRFSRNPFRRRRTPQSLIHHSSHQTNQPKPIYIYPGLLRIVRDKAIALDNQCPAVHYKCRECRKTPTHPPGPPCLHQASCSICLDDFHSKDLVRRLPCNVNHVFHSKCILDWFISHHRCPLCNEPVSNSSIPPLRRDRIASDPTYSDLRRAASYRAVPTFTMDRSRQARLPPQETRLSDAARDTTSATTASTGPPPRDQSCQDGSDRSSKAPQLGEKGKKKSRGPRRYSYIVHDNVRMELNPVIPV